MLQDFKKHIKSQFPFLQKSRILIAISGGIDSVVLSHLCSKLELNFTMAHCNFNLRSKESDDDENFVLSLAETFNTEVFVQHFDTQSYAELHKCSIQMAARELRYDWFQELAQHLNYDYILTAHHKDDDLETFLINFTRGTGLNGLTGIPPKNKNIIRPLLPFSREQIEDYAKTNHIKWREDSSNSSQKYLRNKLRHEVVPILKAINPQVLDTFKNTQLYLNDTASIVKDRIEQFRKTAILKQDDSSISYSITEFKKTKNPKAYLYQLFKNYGFSEWDDVTNLLDAESGKYVKSNTHKLTKHREFLILSLNKKESINRQAIFINEDDQTIKTSIGSLKLMYVNTASNNTQNTIYVDADSLIFPLEFCPYQTGDTFQPLGMKGKKKVSKYLKDKKLTPSKKENTWVLTSNDKVVWVVGLRADERFKITDKTLRIVKLTLNTTTKN